MKYIPLFLLCCFLSACGRPFVGQNYNCKKTVYVVSPTHTATEVFRVSDLDGYTHNVSVSWEVPEHTHDVCILWKWE